MTSSSEHEDYRPEWVTAREIYESLRTGQYPVLTQFAFGPTWEELHLNMKTVFVEAAERGHAAYLNARRTRTQEALERKEAKNV
jgi:hypothetical protein